MVASPEVQRERWRRQLLDESDRLLDEVEELRLHDRRRLPDPVRRDIARLQARFGRADAATAPGNLRAAHDLVLTIQSRLMAANPRNRTTAAHPNRGQGQALVKVLGGGASWKLLALPPAHGAPPEEWRDLVELTVERALDRWSYAQHHAMLAARDRSGARTAIACAKAAWTNYWELRLEADRLLAKAENLST